MGRRTLGIPCPVRRAWSAIRARILDYGMGEGRADGSLNVRRNGLPLRQGPYGGKFRDSQLPGLTIAVTVGYQEGAIKHRPGVSMDSSTLTGRRYVDLTASEKAALPVGTVLRDTGPVHNDYPIPLCRLMADGRWIFDDGSENENWDGYEVVSFVPVSE